MMKRAVWFAVGAVAGVGGSTYAKRKAREAAARLNPVTVAKGAVDRVTDAVREGRVAMAAKEAELRLAQFPADGPEPAPVVLVDASSVEVLRAPRSGPRRRSRR
jgi:hypothetical protein